MNASRALLKRLQTQLTSKAFIARELAQSLVGLQPPLRILIADREGWTDTIRRKFRLTRHVVTFADLRTARLDGYDLIVPLSVDDLQFLDPLRDQLSGNLMPIPSLQSALLCDDKQRFNAFLDDHGLGRHVPRVGAPQAYPYILKRRVDEAGKHSCIVRDRQQELSLEHLRNDPEYFVQEIIGGPIEYATHILIRNGNIICSLNVEYGFDVDIPIKGRDQPRYVLIGHCPYLAQFKAILVAIDFNGLCCVNYKVRDGLPMVMEINPRFGRSLCGYFFAFIRHLRPGRPPWLTNPGRANLPRSHAAPH